MLMAEDWPFRSSCIFHRKILVWVSQEKEVHPEVLEDILYTH